MIVVYCGFQPVFFFIPKWRDINNKKEDIQYKISMLQQKNPRQNEYPNQPQRETYHIFIVLSNLQPRLGEALPL